MEPSESASRDRVGQVLAEYLVEAERVLGDAAGLEAVRSRYVRDHPEMATLLKNHFESEDLLGHGLSTSDPLPQLDRYTEMTEVGRGAMGVVYRAFDRELRRWVALKIPSLEFVAVFDTARFRTEAESMARLNHRNIVRVFDVSYADGRPVISMELVHGSSLQERLGEFKHDRRRLARLMVDVARAVHHAHQRGILHRDLKPSNVLVHEDDHGSVHAFVSDFGLAKATAVDEPHHHDGDRPGQDSLAYGRIVGTACYMAPQQARGEAATTLSDVYGLGGILYALLTGRPPFPGRSTEEILAEVRDETRRPTRPRDFDAGIDRTLEAICLRCLEKDPAHRYRSAEGLAKDLDRWLAFEPTEARPLGAMGRARLWSRRSPLGAALVLVLLMLGALAGLDVANRLEEPRRNRLAVAQQTADLLEARLSDLKEVVESIAGRPGVGGLVARRDEEALQRLIEEEGNRHDDLDGRSPFESVFIVDGRDGRMVARWPATYPASEGGDFRVDAEGFDFRARDYYRGLVASPGPGAYVSQVFRAVTDQLFKFAVSTWVVDEDQRVGIVVATVTTDARMGLPEIDNGAVVTAVLARRDPNPLPGEVGPSQADASPYVILLHPWYTQGVEPRWLPEEYQDDLQAGEAEPYRDPIAGLDGRASAAYGGTWVATFAPVSDSEFVVMVQQRSSSGVRPWMLILVVAVGMLVALALRFRPATNRPDGSRQT